MNVSAFDFNHVKALHFLLEESHVGRAAARLGITAAAASNALRRLREELGDPLLVKKGRGLVRTRVGEDLRGPAREVVASAEQLLRAARPFEPSEFRGQLPIALSEHVAAYLLPALDRLVRIRAPHATLAIAAIPMAVSDWLETSGGVLVSPSGAFAAASAGDSFVSDSFYEDRYVCVLRRGHPAEKLAWNATAYAGQEHVLVLPRGRTPRSDVDDHLATKGLIRRISRLVPSFTLALSVVRRSDLITTMPERCVQAISKGGIHVRPLPFRLDPLVMRTVVSPAHAGDARTEFIKHLLRASLASANGAK